MKSTEARPADESTKAKDEQQLETRDSWSVTNKDKIALSREERRGEAIRDEDWRENHQEKR